MFKENVLDPFIKIVECMGSQYAFCINEKFYTYNDFGKNSFSGLVFLNRNIRIDILWVTDLNNMEEIRNMVSTLAVYGRKHRFSYIRFFTANRKLSEYLKISAMSIVTHPRFVFHVNNSELDMKLQGLPWEIELIDCDFEFGN